MLVVKWAYLREAIAHGELSAVLEQWKDSCGLIQHSTKCSFGRNEESIIELKCPGKFIQLIVSIVVAPLPDQRIIKRDPEGQITVLYVRSITHCDGLSAVVDFQWSSVELN
jgi:hypothetical protein